MNIFEYEHDNNLLEVEYEYYPAELDQPYDSNGEPGTQGSGHSIEIYHIWSVLNDRLGNAVSVDVQDIVDVDLETIILEFHD